MVFEAAFMAAAVVCVVLFVVYVRMRRSSNRLREENAANREAAEMLSSAREENTKLCEENTKLREENTTIKAENAAAKVTVNTLPDIIKGMVADINKEHGESFKDGAVEPMRKMVEGLETKIDELGKQNAGNTAKFDERMGELKRNTDTLTEIFKSSRKRGRHAETSLERLFEIAGLKKGINYETQVRAGGKQPDFIVRLSENRSIVIDSKAPLDALWNSFDAESEDEKSHALGRYIDDVRGRIRELAGKKYQESHDMALEYVVLVMPEYALLPALDRDGKLVEFALERKVILVTPSTLLMLLHTVEMTWRQSRMAESVRNIGEVASDLHSKLRKFAEHYNNTGKGLETALKHYNAGAGSWESRLRPAAARLAEAGADVKEMPKIDRVEGSAKPLPILDD